MLALLQRLIDKYNEIQGAIDGKKLCDWLNAHPEAPTSDLVIVIKKCGYKIEAISLDGATEIYKKGSRQLTIEYVTEEE
jgi:hypothetical protein